ncbi:Hat1p-Hat2p histone acetyltransferase complex subunit [Komagataella phaffii CBS 7435]|uniref:Histone acetyltransferase type B catalytic subunit n=2 Tax=Komagataella phaffii TaxID=460519 RepID=C4R3X6_KOMPG|nr:Catalytic subunit of the Hat1p-Hat2p histone acetyltransferase complex [Komagataella phaffii GS115]AOA64063.1 GQ67_03275T0 [Komagataella phaffii]CAH2449997.1 Hat1p-Hat2p histone acetyltransferase complex subunit [Komagataella phaffii CBS 7435]AOA68224.1 GQ68_03244T0 [Komagataella phaffii GS115]CAY70244.1 Catalytic subunit of the Hat1p-Hat2p histone acetyltransferase complex [Komagataella phaffii GS115]CCA39944.1 Hat1p-Hat2p histone acetyltransferase complex subunit [Komagataella phaffii CBS
MTDLSSLDPNIYTSSSNEALSISLAGNGKAVSFHPDFTYPIFGDAEQIFGYKDLVIHLVFDSMSLYPFLNVRYSEKRDDADEVESKLLELLPEETVVKDEALWQDKIDGENFEIPGEILSTYTHKDENYHVYKLSINKCAESLQLHRRMQIFVLFFIEAGSYIDAKDDMWEIYVVYKEDKTFIGFATGYSYWKYPGHEIFDSDAKYLWRKKISQFVILPPYQGQSHGSQLYKTIFEQWFKDDQVAEITVEDPSEAFDDLRDRCDLERLYQRGLLETLPEPVISPEWFQTQQAKEKIEKRQFQRCVEMLLLHALKSKKNTRLQIKKRLFIKNRDALLDLDEATRKDKLQVAYERLEEDYQRILEKVRFVKKRPHQDT